MFFDDWARTLICVSFALSVVALLVSSICLGARFRRSQDLVTEVCGHVVHALGMVYMALAMMGHAPGTYFRLSMAGFMLLALYFVWRAGDRLFDGNRIRAYEDIAHAASCGVMAYMFIDLRLWPIWITLAATVWCAWLFARSFGRTVTLADVRHVEVRSSLVAEELSHTMTALAMMTMFVAMQSAQETARMSGVICGVPQ